MTARMKMGIKHLEKSLVSFITQCPFRVVANPDPAFEGGQPKCRMVKLLFFRNLWFKRKMKGRNII